MSVVPVVQAVAVAVGVADHAAVSAVPPKAALARRLLLVVVL